MEYLDDYLANCADATLTEWLQRLLSIHSNQ